MEWVNVLNRKGNGAENRNGVLLITGLPLKKDRT